MGNGAKGTRLLRIAQCTPQRGCRVLDRVLTCSGSAAISFQGEQAPFELEMRGIQPPLARESAEVGRADNAVAWC